MSTEVRNLEPKALWNHFADLNAVPRPSKHEERAIAFAKAFGESLGLPVMVDAAGNVIIKKPATTGMEDRVTVVMQGHLDMVHQKNADTNFDFNTQGIEMYVDGDWVKAKGTTLGADNGLGVAAIMSILASKDIAHPAIEALFTIDEETGMTGAKELKGGLLHGSIMLNLDTEEDNELTIGCAGGVDVTGQGSYAPEKLAAGYKGFRIGVKGLTGGHSGVDIHRGRGNANKIMNRILFEAHAQFGLRVSSVDGGSLRNAIPRESFAIVAIPDSKSDAFLSWLGELARVLKAENHTTDPGLEVTNESVAAPAEVLPADFQYKVLRSVYTCPNGIYRMSPDIAGLVQTSNNLSRVLIRDGSFSLQNLTRSSVNTEKTDLANAVRSALELCGATVTTDGDYTGWTPNPDAAIVKLMSGLYKEMFGHEADVNACHAGLECGILGQNYPGMEMISFGPTIRGAHSPDEKAQISSVQKFWGFLLETLKRIPVAGSN